MEVTDIRTMKKWISQTTYRAVCGSFGSNSEKEAIRYAGRSISYGRFLSEVDAVASAFTRLGVSKGDRVLLCLPNVPNVVVSVYALHKIGAVACPVHPKSSVKELSFYISDTDSCLAVCYAPLLPFLSEAREESKRNLPVITVSDQETFLFSDAVPITALSETGDLTWKGLLAMRGAEVNESTDPKALAIIFYSGGTTGTPKGIMLSSENLNALAYQTEYGSGLIPMSDYSMLAVIPMFHGFGFGVNVHLMLSRGGTSILIPKFSAVELGDVILREKPSIIAGIPSLFHAAIMALDGRKCDLSFLAGAFSGGDSVPQQLKDSFDAFAERHGSSVRLREGYGLTESVTVSCITDWDGGKRGSMGMPLLGNDFRICAPGSDEPLPPFTQGEICFSGPTVMMGYLNHPEESALALHRVGEEIVLHTGDCGYIDEEGYVYFSSRLSRMIVTSGYNVYPAEVEDVVSSLPGVRQACCVGVPDDIKGRSICLLVVPADDVDKEDVRVEIKKACENGLAEYKRPETILFRESFPLTNVGKIAYGEIQKQAENAFIKKASSPIEAISFAAKEVLGIDSIENAEEFLKAGGNSLKILAFLVALTKQGYELSLADFVAAETKEEVVAALRPLHSVLVRYENEAVAEELKKEGLEYETFYPAGPMQESILYNCSISDKKSVYNTLVILRALRAIDKAWFMQAAELMIEKYDAFRTVFRFYKDGNFAVVRKKPICPIQCVESDLPIAEFSSDLAKKGFDPKNNVFRILLVKAADGEFVLYNVHHAVSDGISIFNAISYFIDSYLRLEKGEAFDSLKKKMVRNDGFDYYSFLHNLGNADDPKAEDLFRREFEGFEGGDIIQPSRKPDEGDYGKIDFALTEEADRKLRDFCQKNEFTLRQVCDAVWAVILSKYTFTEDVAFGEVVSGREESVEGIEKAVGLFINTVPMRLSVRPEKTIKDLLKEIKEKSISHLPYLTYPISKLIRLIGNNAISTIVNYSDNDGKKYGIGADIFEQEYLIDNSNYNLEFEISGKDRTVLGLRYDKSVYSAEDMRMLADRIVRVFETAVTKDVRIKDIVIESREDIDKIASFNKTGYAFDENETVVDRFEKQAEKTPERVAVTSYDRTLTYRELDERSDGVAAFLKDNGIKKGDCIALRISRCPEMITAIFGVLKAGAIYLPLDESYPEERLLFVLADSGAKAVLTDDEGRATELPTFDVRAIPIAPKQKTPISGDDGAYYIYTSGTTGRPKGVVTLHKGLSNLLLSYEKIYDLTEKDVVLQVASYTFDQSVWDIFGVLCVGGKLALISRDDVRDPEMIARRCRQEKVTIASFTPAMIAELDPNSFPSLRILDSSGEAANSTVLRRWLGKVKVINTYGPTEYSVNACSYEYKGEEDNVPIGKPILNTRFFVVDKCGKACGAGRKGELCIAGTGLSAGYLGRPGLNEEKFVPACDGVGKMYRTGDLVCIRNDGIIEYIGRMDEQVKIRGFRIELGEVDACVRKCEGVEDCCVAVKMLNGDKILCAYIVGGNVERIREEVKKRLPSYMTPHFFVPITRIPRTLSGKTDVFALPLPDVRTISRTSPATKEQKAVAEAFKAVLNCSDVCVEDDFFSLGGDSIKAIRLSAILKIAGYALSVRDVMGKKTVEQMAEAVRPDIEEEPGLESDTDETENKFGDRVEKAYPLTPLQEGMYFHSLYDNTLEYLSQVAIRTAPLDENCLYNALKLLFVRYDVLRTAFVSTEKGGVQLVLKDRTPDFSVADGDVIDIVNRDIERGFDLERDVLFRVTYVRGEQNYLVFLCHHLIADGWSNEALYSNFFRYYDRLKKNENFDDLCAEAKEEAKRAPSFSDFVKRILKKDQSTAHAYYEDLQKDFCGALDYPSASLLRPELGVAKERTEVFPYDIFAEARRLSTTGATLVETAWGVTLGIASGACDAMFGNVLSGRNEPIDGIEEMVGMLISTAPVRVRFDRNTTFRDLIKEVERQNLNNIEYGFVPLTGKAVRMGSIVVFNDFDGIKGIDNIVSCMDQTNYDVEIEIGNGGKEYTLRYNGHRYSEEEADELVDLFAKTLSALVYMPDAGVLETTGKELPLRTIIEEKEESVPEYVPLSTEKEKLVAKCMSEILGIDEIDDANADFIRYGGDSIKAIRLSAKLRNHGYRLTVKEIMEGKTIERMAWYAKNEEGLSTAFCGTVPLTPVMTDFFERNYSDPDGYVQEVLIKSEKSFGPVREALQAVYEHHDMLRATFSDGRLIVPEVSESAPLSYEETETDDVIKTCAGIRKKIKMSGPTFTAALIRKKGAEYLYLCAHHLVVDGVSWRVILEDISFGCAGEKLPKKTSSYLTWAKNCAAGVKISEKERDFWSRTEERVTPVFTETGNAPFSIEFSLSKEETDRISKNAGRIFGARQDVIMLTALARAVSRTFGKEETAVLMESHGRQPLFDGDISRTVGWFTSYYPVVFSGQGSEEECVTENKERLLSVPEGGVRYQFMKEKTAPDIIFNYMGEYDIGNSSVELCSLPISETNREREALDVEGEINGGILNFSLRFNGPSKEVGERLKESFRQELLSLCALCSDEKEKILSPADLGYPGMDKDDFVEVMKVCPVRIAPLTPTQQGMLFHSEDNKEEYLEQSAVRLPFVPDVKKAEKLLNALANKYAVFRTVYVLCKSGNIYQCVLASAHVEVNVEDDLSVVRKRRVKEGVSPFDGVPLRLDIVGDILLITSHHILLDAWSEGLFIDEFEKLYKEDRMPEKIEDASFCDYASEYPYKIGASDYAYWKNLVEGAASSFVPGHGGGVRGENRHTVKEICSREKALSFVCKNGVTENSVFEAAVARFIQIVCGKTDVIFGKVVSGRDAKTANAVGLYIATVPVRVRAENAREVLIEIEKQASDSSRYEICPLNEIFKRARIRDPIGMLFVYDSIESKARTKPLYVRDSTNYGITLAVSKEDKFIADISYNDGEYLPEEIDAFLSLYADCVDEILEGKETVYEPLSGPKVSYPSTLTEIWNNRADFTLIADKEYSAEEIRRRAEILSGYLHEHCDKGIVGVRLERGVNMIVALLGIVLSGNAYLPIGTDYPEERVQFMVEDSGVRTILDQNFMSSFRYDGSGFVADVKGEDFCYVIYTSGSTGRPKGVRISHRAIANRLCWMENKYPLAGGAVLQKTPYTFDVSVWDIFRPLLFGGRLVLTPPGLHAEPKTIAALVKKYSVTQAHFVPSVYDIYLEYCQENGAAPIKDLFLSGEKLGKKTVEKHNAVFGKKSSLHNLYGPTECAVDVAYYDLKGNETDVPIGKPIDNTEISVVSCGKVVPPYVEGEIVVGGVNVGSGYIGKNRGGFVGGKYFTGDIGWTDKNGQVHFVGRKDRQLKWNGMRIEPGEIEWQIGKIDGVKDVVVDVAGKVPALCAFIVCEDKEKTEEEIRRRLPEYLLPARRIYVDKIPLSDNGKRNLAALLQAFEENISLPRTAKTILEAVEEIIGEKIGFDTPFEEAGIGSLERIRLSVRLAPYGFSFADLVRANSVRELYLREHNEYFMKFVGGNEKAVVCIPYAGGTARVYKNLSPAGYDVYAAVSCTFDEKDWSAVIQEIQKIKAGYKKVVLYAHCLGSMTALKLAREVGFDLVVFGAHVPDAVSSFFGRPVDSWKHSSDKSILAALAKGGLKGGETDFAPLFRKDASRAARIEAEKPILSAPVVLLLAEKDPFAASQKAKKRWKKFVNGEIKTTILAGKDHYFISDKDFDDTLLSTMEYENE